MNYNILLVSQSPDFFDWINEHNVSNKLQYLINPLEIKDDIPQHIITTPIDLIIVDWQAEHGDTESTALIKKIKFNSQTNQVPTILCTNRECPIAQVMALNEGSDDYFSRCKPIEVLFSKINALLRKTNRAKHDRITLRRKICMNEDCLEVDFFGVKHKLTKKEFIILKTLVDNPGKVFSQDQLNSLTSGEDVFVSKRSVDTFVSLIRNKLGKQSILSIKKKGYMLNLEVLDTLS